MRYVVTGRVHPERADIHFSNVEWKIPKDGRVFARCDSSQITICLELSSIDGCATAFIAAEHFSMIIVGALGFSLGSGYSVELIQVTEENGTPHVFGVRPVGSEPEQTLGFDPHGPVLNRAFQLANANVFFRLALRDFLRAITDPTDCATYCFRAIEGIKSAFIFKTGKDRWDDMHAALSTDRATIDSTIKKFADPIRHGNWVNAKPTDGETRWQMLQLTRDILLKFLDYELRTI
jgi:hypothetical protein